MVNYRQFLQGGNLLTLLTIIGVGIGLGIGIGIRQSIDEPWIARNAMYLRLPGDLFIRALSGLMLPLIFSTLVSATGSLDIGLSKRIGTRALVYYLSTSALAGILGTTIVHFAEPGKRADHGSSTEECRDVCAGGSSVDTLLDLLRNVFPNNIVGAATQNTRTIVTQPQNAQNLSIPFEKWPYTVGMVEGTNMLGLVVFALVLGIILAQMRDAGKPLLVVFNSMGTAMLKITSIVIWYGPVAVIFLISGQLVTQGDINDVFQTLTGYIAVMVGAHLIHGFVVLPILFTLLTRKLPFRFIVEISQAIFTAFGTASSTATLPITLKCLEENHRMDTRITRFLIPIGATVNMDGAAIGIPLRVIYIAQLCGRSLSFGDLVSIMLTSLAISVGAAGIPGVGMVVAITMLASLGLPVGHIGYLLPQEWLQDRVVTVVNVMGDAYGAAIIGQMSKSDLDKIPIIPETIPSGS